jgi:hypothetical protein
MSVLREELELAPAVPDAAVPLPVPEPDFDAEFAAEFDATVRQFQPLDPDRFDAPPQRHLRAVPPRGRRQPRFGLWIGSIVTAASLFLLVAFNVFMVQGQFELDRIDQQRTLEQKEYASLRAQVADLSSPEAIVGKATSLGLITPPNGPTFLHAPTAGATPPPRDDTATTQKDTRLGTPIAASP